MSIDVSTVSNITHSIQLAVAPVFFLTAVAGMIGAVAGRLARIIDRGRTLEDRMLASHDAEYIQRSLLELSYLRRRGRLANVCIGLLTLCGTLIAMTIVLLFLGQASGMHLNVETWSLCAMASFGLGVISFVAALCCFMVETMMATRLLNFQPLRGGPAGRLRAGPKPDATPEQLRQRAASVAA